MKKLFITTPIYYPNARPHVGSAYTTIVCDAIARYKCMCGYDVAFLTGTDEHGEKLQRAAEAAGTTPAAFVAEKRTLFTKLWDTLGIPQYSAEHPAGYRFVHTSQNPDHVKSVHWMIRQAQKAGMPYCARCESYLERRIAPLKCPKCDAPAELRSAVFKRRYEGRYCVFDERYVSDSIEPANCDICGRPAELISEENYFFRLSAFQDRLLRLYDDHPEFVMPDFRMNEVKSFVKSGLRDISISRRRLEWGIPWPDDPEQVVYVWYDALTSYLTGIGFRGSDKPEPDFDRYWMDPDAERVHMIGKDILRFHAVYWPAFLMAANDALPEAEKLPLPTTIFAHGWIYYEQDKMSKSKGNVVYPEPIVKAFEEFGAPGNDALRYYLLRDTPLGLDGRFSYEGLIQRYNSDLANGLGNLANRTIAMIGRFAKEGTVPEPPKVATSGKVQPTRQSIDNVLREFPKRLSDFDIFGALAGVFEVVRDLNGFITSSEPWAIAASIGKSAFPPAASDVRQAGEETHFAEGDSEKTQQALDETLYVTVDALRGLATLVSPFIPEASRQLWRQLGCEGRIENQRVDQLARGQLKPGTKVGKPEPVFPRLDKEKALRRLDELAEEDRLRDEKTKEEVSQVEPQPAPGRAERQETRDVSSAAEQIAIDDFAKVDLRAGTVLSAEPIPGATKLLKLQVDIGAEIRQVCAGIAEYYKPEDLIGMKVVLVANLQPRKLRGVESNGMIVAASVGEENRPVLVTFKEDVPNGARLR